MHCLSYGFSEGNDIRITGTVITSEKQKVNFTCAGESLEITLSVPGDHNALNALGVYAMARGLGLQHDEIKPGLLAFTGTQRRFEKVQEKNGVQYYDDYAHHPLEITSTLKTAKEWLPNSRLVAVFSTTYIFLEQKLYL